MNKELVLKATAAVIDFNESQKVYAAGSDVKIYGNWFYISAMSNTDYIMGLHDPSDEQLNEFIDKLEELSK